jgi:hypothetical protein
MWWKSHGISTERVLPLKPPSTEKKYEVDPKFETIADLDLVHLICLIVKTEPTLCL